jgi:hypothetical protein
MTPFESFSFGNEACAWLPTINLHRKHWEINDALASRLASHTWHFKGSARTTQQTAGRHPSGEGEALSRYCAGHWAACAVFWAGAPSRQCRAASISASVAP